MTQKWQIEDEDGNVLYGKTFKHHDDAWSFIYNKYPVIYNDDGTRDDQEEILDEHYVVKIT
jgi:hypothetical protein